MSVQIQIVRNIYLENDRYNISNDYVKFFRGLFIIQEGWEIMSFVKIRFVKIRSKIKYNILHTIHM